jgi:hypothetical protein
MTKDEIEELNRDCRRATKLLLRTYLGTTSLSYKDLAAQIGYSEHQTRNFLNDALYDTIWSQHHRRSILGEPLPKPICFTESFE